MITEFQIMKMQQLEAMLASMTGGHGVDHLEPDQVMAMLNACHALVVEALRAA